MAKYEANGTDSAVGMEMGTTYRKNSTMPDEKGSNAMYDPSVTDTTQYDDDGHVARTGTVWSASAHVITAVIGSGVLSLAWAFAQLGWVAGPLVLLAFGGVTYYTSLLLADCYRAPDKATGKRNPTYMASVRALLGPKQVIACGILQYINLFGVCVGYTITASRSLVAMGQAECYHHKGHDADCSSKLTYYMTGFGVVQIIFSQIPDFHNLWWLSAVAAVMSFSYSGIGLGLGVAKTIGNGHIKGTLTGVPIGSGHYTVAQKTYSILNALGDIAFAYSFSAILNNIQDTLRSPPAENKTMHKATLISVLTTTLFYMSVGCAGYAAFGNSAPGDLMTGFGFYNPAWLVLFANLCIVIHLVGAYQVYAQPVFSLVEQWLTSLMPKSSFVHSEYRLGPFSVNPLRLAFRTAYVCVTTILALLLPFFNAIMGFLGAIGFWPLTIYFPIQMYISQTNLSRPTGKWWLLQSLSFICLIITLGATVGSIDGIIESTKTYKPFS